MANTSKQGKPKGKNTSHFDCSQPPDSASTGVWSKTPDHLADQKVAAQEQQCACELRNSPAVETITAALCESSNGTGGPTFVEQRLLCDSLPTLSSELPKLRWLHIPKTGTSFAMTVFHIGCQFELPRWASIRYNEMSPPLQGIWSTPGLEGKRRDTFLSCLMTSACMLQVCLCHTSPSASRIFFRDSVVASVRPLHVTALVGLPGTEHDCAVVVLNLSGMHPCRPCSCEER